MKRFIYLLLVVVLALGLLAGCGGDSGDVSYIPGTYTGKSGKDDSGAYGEVTVTIQDNRITDCVFITWQQDGTIKDEEYGKVNGAIANQDYYDKAQAAVKAMPQYAQQLAEVQKPEEVDVISGATVSHDQFVEAVENALQAAQE